MTPVSLLLPFFLGVSLHLTTIPETVSWEQLRDVQFKKKWYPEEGVVMLYPHFGNSVKALSGKSIRIAGYVLPIDLERGIYVVSRFPMAACFFCGAAGPESIIALKFKRLPYKFKTDERRTFSGTLRLNADNIYELNYILEDAELQ
ncbi:MULTISPECIES: DUF3299 domain-containing protein [unclassified Spirosoma]|uniref:DUF3299 domain-containing protein n=1 Tax=unclassified Spirosoma TaxID=2621999 RepID=UPI000964FE33|nr:MULTISPECIES: DUF3299 domain-containing protein [unclassified Spirosoma]MBN8824335.1 DUF3299 domain-containing protein [Spirosoma sp.]OJW70198.1 MAG: DUF3299 domain-containing protein [Spirosoma sp. 48-14]